MQAYIIHQLGCFHPFMFSLALKSVTTGNSNGLFAALVEIDRTIQACEEAILLAEW